jgi:hypothetical protein
MADGLLPLPLNPLMRLPLSPPDKLRAFFDASSTASAKRKAAAVQGAGGAPDRSPAVVTVEGRTHPVQVGLLSAAFGLLHDWLLVSQLTKSHKERRTSAFVWLHGGL